LKFIPVEWFLAKLQPLGFEILPNIDFSLCEFKEAWGYRS
jgi:hypothetical protein